MKLLRFNLLALSFAVSAAALSAQTLYVPSGTSGIGSSSSNVGIGTSSPGSYLPGVVGATIYGNYPALSLSGSETGGNFFLLYENAGSFRVYSNSGTADRLTIDAAGNVGVGTATPASKLHVAGTNTAGILVDAPIVPSIKLERTNATGVSATGNIDWIGNDNAVGARIGVNDDVAGSMAFKLGGSALSNTRILISSAGNVGIGVTTPYARLHVSQNIAEASAMSISSTALAKISNTNNTTGNLSLLKFSGPDNDTSVLLGSALNNASNGDSAFVLGVRDGSGTLTEKFRVTSGGNVGIGTTSPAQKLSVNGTIRAKEVIVDTGWSDYVFKPDYKLASLSEVEGVIKRDGHLPGIPSAQEVAEHGVSMGEMQSKLLAKIEELTLHQIEQEKAISALRNENAALHARVATLERAPTKP